MDTLTLGATDARHLYAIEIDGTIELYVYANTRTSAALIAKRAGYVVRSVNMIG